GRDARCVHPCDVGRALRHESDEVAHDHEECGPDGDQRDGSQARRLVLHLTLGPQQKATKEGKRYFYSRLGKNISQNRQILDHSLANSWATSSCSPGGRGTEADSCWRDHT